jgi:nicotinate phosphoribosyltransferase
MDTLRTLYRHSLALLTDLYQLTMAYGYWKSGLAEREAAFHLFFRRHPFDGGYTVACGLGTVIEYIDGWRFPADDLQYLQSLTGADGKPLFETAFLDYLGRLEFSCDIDAVPEGTVVHPQEPLVRLRGPILQCQILETPLLNIVNFQTLVATKTARICWAAQGDPVIEFGLRRAQGFDGALSASRAAVIGGCAGTSNVLAGKLYGTHVLGTHAHSWIMTFKDELEAFAAYARALPNNCVFLVDTFDTLQGVRHAAQIGRRLRDEGHEMVGIRLDSGDLAWLSHEARKILDQEGFPDARIVASNDLDERLIASLKQQGAAINVWGVGTKLVTAFDQPALGGVYKLGAIRGPQGDWQYRIKLSEQTLKITNPGVLQVRRFEVDGLSIGDMLYDEQLGAVSPDKRLAGVIIDPLDPNREKRVPAGATHTDLLLPVYRGGRRVVDPPPLQVARERVTSELSRLSEAVKRFDNPHEYPVGLEPQLHALKTRLVRAARGLSP